MKLEDKFLMYLTCKSLDFPAYQDQEMIGDKIFDWDYLIQASLSHGLFLLIYEALLKDQHTDISYEYKIQFKELARKLTQKSLLMSSELIQVYDLLERHGISVIPFKGPTLSSVVYGKEGKRIFGDLDILVGEDGAAKAVALLIERGYKPLIELDREQFLKYLLLEDDIQLSHPNGTIIEVHWEASGRYLESPFDYKYLEPRIIYANFHGKELKQFAYEDLLIYLCLHGTRHLWTRLEWLCSVASLIQRSNLNDCSSVLIKAKKLGCWKIVLHTIFMVKEVFGVDSPVFAEEAIGHKKKLGDSVCYNNKLLFPLWRQNDLKIGQRFVPSQLYLRDSWIDSIKYLFGQIFRLRVADIQYIRLPSNLFILYYIIRPYRLTLKLLHVI